MMTKDTAESVARAAARKTHEPHGVFEQRPLAGAIYGVEPEPARYFSRKLNGEPPKHAKLVLQVWPNGITKRGDE